MSWKVGDLVEYTDTQDRIRYAIIERHEAGAFGQLRVRTISGSGEFSPWSHLFTGLGLRVPSRIPDELQAARAAWLITGGQV